MTITIDYKSTGTLLNEYITATLKKTYIGDKQEFRERITDLQAALEKRKAFFGQPRFDIVEADFDELQRVLLDLWWAVEETIKLRRVDKEDIEQIKAAGYAALKAFELNAKRCDIIRIMDAKLGEESVTFLEKSY